MTAISLRLANIVRRLHRTGNGGSDHTWSYMCMHRRLLHRDASLESPKDADQHVLAVCA